MSVGSKQKHDFGVGVNLIFISMLCPSSNRSRKKTSLSPQGRRRTVEDLGQDSLSTGQSCDWALLNTKPKFDVLDPCSVHGSTPFHSRGNAVYRSQHDCWNTEAEQRTALRAEWNHKKWLKVKPLRRQLVLVAHSGLHRCIEQGTDGHC